MNTNAAAIQKLQALQAELRRSADDESRQWQQLLEAGEHGRAALVRGKVLARRYDAVRIGELLADLTTGSAQVSVPEDRHEAQLMAYSEFIDKTTAMLARLASYWHGQMGTAPLDPGAEPKRFAAAAAYGNATATLEEYEKLLTDLRRRQLRLLELEDVEIPELDGYTGPSYTRHVEGN